MKSRPLQYLGLAALLLFSLAVIFFPIGSRPEAQTFTVPLVAPKTFQELAGSTQKVDDVAEKAFVTAFPKTTTLPGALTLVGDGKTATVQDTATTRAEATARAAQMVAALSKKFKGVVIGPTFAQNLEKLPDQPLFSLGKTAVYSPKTQDGSAIPAVKLGLDLQGGVNLVLQVRRALFSYAVTGAPTEENARNAFLDQVRAALSQTETAAGLRGADVSFDTDAQNQGAKAQIKIRTQAADRAQFNAQTQAIGAALKTVKGATIAPAGEPQFYLSKESEGEKLGYKNGSSDSDLLKKTVEIIRSRVDKLGVSEPLIQAQPPDRVLVQLPGVNDPQKAVAIIGTTAQMEIRLLPQGLTPVPDRKDANNTLFADAKGNIVTSEMARAMSEIIVEGKDVKPTTSAGFSEGGTPAVFFEMQGDGARKFATVTTQVAGKNRFIPIFLDNKCISAPTVVSPITGGSGQISGGFETIEEARDLAVLLNSGALPAPIDVVENRTVSATLGKDSLVKSLKAGLIGLLAVAIFMIVYYRLAGVLANCALIVYCVVNLAVFVLVGGTLTLPGIAGFLLALAMSLDTNILVFERLKEEMAIQPTFAAALRAAFSRAWTAILDSHVTTLIAATVLFYLGTGPIKGFALTLGIGVLLSLFSAISVTRLFMWSVVGIGERNRSLFAGKLLPTQPSALQKAK